MRRAAGEEDASDARRYVKLLDLRLRMLDPERRRDVIAELHAVLARE